MHPPAGRRYSSTDESVVHSTVASRMHFASFHGFDFLFEAHHRWAVGIGVSRDTDPTAGSVGARASLSQGLEHVGRFSVYSDHRLYDSGYPLALASMRFLTSKSGGL
jgi:hypothetical protein